MHTFKDARPGVSKRSCFFKEIWEREEIPEDSKNAKKNEKFR